jgi:hypothetical protein
MADKNMTIDLLSRWGNHEPSRQNQKKVYTQSKFIEPEKCEIIKSRRLFPRKVKSVFSSLLLLLLLLLGSRSLPPWQVRRGKQWHSKQQPKNLTKQKISKRRFSFLIWFFLLIVSST